jgi:hypothetical protein
MPKLMSRCYHNGDINGIVSLYNLVTGRSRTVEQHEWEWLYTPEGQGSIWVIEETESREIIGHHGLIPIRLVYLGKPVLAGKTENTILHPRYEGTGIYFKYERGYVKEAERRFDLLYTTAGSGVPGKIRLQLGYGIVGGYARYIKITNRQDLKKVGTDFIKRRISNNILSLLLCSTLKLTSTIVMRCFSKRGPTDVSVKLEKIMDIEPMADEWDRFWSADKDKFGITADRNSKYLKWRIFNNPHIGYDFFLARKHGSIVGYVITKTRREEGAAIGAIVDLIVGNNNPVIFNSILKRVETIFYDNGIGVIHFSTLLSDNFLNKYLRGNGFVLISPLREYVWNISRRKVNESLLMAKVLKGTLDPARVLDAASWYFTDIMTEGVN